MGNKSNKNKEQGYTKLDTNQKEYDKISAKVIVGIDFGTSGIGYAYSFTNNQDQIFLSDFNGQSADKKVKSEIILDNDLKDVLAFGNECKGYIFSHEKNTYQYFKNIKMNLYKKIYTVKSTEGKEANIEIIITKILKQVSNQALSQIKRANDRSIENKDIKWVVTIPAIWEEKSKEVMINASKAAGLINENTDLSLFLALEPEVAGIYYFSYLSSLNDEHINNGEPYIICDIGAGTVDICTHRKIKNDSMKSELIEEYPPIWGDYGGNYINEEFIKRFIIEVFGEENVKKNRNDITSEEWDEFEEKIESLKRRFDENEPCDFKLDCSIFQDNSIDKNLEDYISDYKKSRREVEYIINKTDNPRRNWELSFPSKIFSDITKEIAKKIFSKIEEIYNNVNTEYIILTGAGSKNNNISQYLYDFAKEKNMKNFMITTPVQPEISIIKGAVLFGFKNDIIRKRKSKYTIGINFCRAWDENIHKNKGIKFHNELVGDQCSSLFYKFITKNEFVEFNQVISHEFNSITSIPSLIFYKTLKNNCTYINEKDENDELIIYKFGQIEFDIGNDYDINNRMIKVDMKMGGTYIDVSASYLKTGKKIKTIQTFV